MERWHGKLALVTGAAGGIGAAISEALLNNNVNVLALDLRAEDLLSLKEKIKTAKGQLYLQVCDVTKEEDAASAFKLAKDMADGIDIMINSAGVSQLTTVIDSDVEGFVKVLNVNVLAVAMFTKFAVQSMREKNSAGHIINVNSIAGHYLLKSPRGLYPTSKHAVTAMTETVRRELSQAGSKIKISSISPGATRTGLLAAVDPNIVMPNIPRLQPSDIAAAVIYILSTPPEVQIAELTIRHIGETL